jgi:hypothetical protein
MTKVQVSTQIHPHELMRALRSITIAAERFEPDEWSLWDAECLEGAARVIREGIAERAGKGDRR